MTLKKFNDFLKEGKTKGWDDHPKATDRSNPKVGEFISADGVWMEIRKVKIRKSDDYVSIWLKNPKFPNDESKDLLLHSDCISCDEYTDKDGNRIGYKKRTRIKSTPPQYD